MNYNQFKICDELFHFLLKQSDIIFNVADFVAIKTVEDGIYCVMKDRLGLCSENDRIDETTYRNIISQYDCPVVLQTYYKIV